MRDVSCSHFVFFKQRDLFYGLAVQLIVFIPSSFRLVHFFLVFSCFQRRILHVCPCFFCGDPIFEMVKHVSVLCGFTSSACNVFITVVPVFKSFENLCLVCTIAILSTRLQLSCATVRLPTMSSAKQPASRVSNVSKAKVRTAL